MAKKKKDKVTKRKKLTKPKRKSDRQKSWWRIHLNGIIVGFIAGILVVIVAAVISPILNNWIYPPSPFVDINTVSFSNSANILYLSDKSSDNNASVIFFMKQSGSRLVKGEICYKIVTVENVSNSCGREYFFTNQPNYLRLLNPYNVSFCSSCSFNIEQGMFELELSANIGDFLDRISRLGQKERCETVQKISICPAYEGNSICPNYEGNLQYNQCSKPATLIVVYSP
jgi:hypothetical protein